MTKEDPMFIAFMAGYIRREMENKALVSGHILEVKMPTKEWEYDFRNRVGMDKFQEWMSTEMTGKQLPDEVLTHVPQMSLRDWFAGQASNEDILDMQLCKDPGMVSRQDARYMVADAMLKARESQT